MEATQSPIFIGGPDRCGKTTLAALLSSHSRISIPAVGSNLWTYFYGQYGDLRQPANFERCLQALLHYKHAVYLKPDAERLRQDFWQGEPTYARLFALLHVQYAQRAGKPRWGDQTGLVERYAPQIFEAHPQAKFVHLLRDPRDRYEASLAMWPAGKGRVGAAAARWTYSARLAEQNQQRFGDRYLILRFEDLVRETEAWVRQVCDFLGEAYEPQMLAMTGASGHRKKLVGENYPPQSPVQLSESFIGRYRLHVPKVEIAFLQQAARKPMQRFGYASEPLPLTKPEQIRYWMREMPLNSLRMKSWLVMEKIQHQFPRWFGRKPGKHMVVQALALAQENE